MVLQDGCDVIGGMAASSVQQNLVKLRCAGRRTSRSHQEQFGSQGKQTMLCLTAVQGEAL